MANRTEVQEDYRFGFNGKENDNETSTQDYGMRIYYPALGRFLSVDPLSPQFPFYTPYQFAGNKPISNIDLDGLEDLYFMDKFIEHKGETAFAILNTSPRGRDYIDKFKNTDPNKYEGSVNLGYDLFIQKKDYGASTGGMTYPNLRFYGVLYLKEDLNGKAVGRKVRIIDAIYIAKSDKNSLEYKTLSQLLGDDILFSDGLEKSIKNGREGIILIGINDDQSFLRGIFKNNETFTTAGKAISLGHEIKSHAINQSRYTFEPGEYHKDAIEEHKDVGGIPSMDNLYLPGSEEDLFHKEIMEFLKDKKR